MQITINLTKDDIETTKLGSHYEINVSDNLVINFTPDAIEELIKDVNDLKQF